MLRMTPAAFVCSRIPVAAFFTRRAWRLTGKPLWFICAIPPLLYVYASPATRLI